MAVSGEQSPGRCALTVRLCTLGATEAMMLAHGFTERNARRLGAGLLDRPRIGTGVLLAPRLDRAEQDPPRHRILVRLLRDGVVTAADIEPRRVYRQPPLCFPKAVQ